MMTMLLPIPTPKEALKFFYIPFKIGANYCNYSGEIKVRSADPISTIRAEIESNYKLSQGSYLITKVTDNEFIRWFGANQQVETLQKTEAITIMYQLDPRLNP